MSSILRIAWNQLYLVAELQVTSKNISLIICHIKLSTKKLLREKVKLRLLIVFNTLFRKSYKILDGYQDI